MTTPMMTLAELAEKGPDVHMLRQMVQLMAQRLMEIRCRGPLRRRLRREGAARATQQPQRLPRAHLGHARRKR